MNKSHRQASYNIRIEQQERKKKREFVKRMKESLNLLVRRDSRKFKNIENSDNNLKNQVEKEDRVAILSFEKKKKNSDNRAEKLQSSVN